MKVLVTGCNGQLGHDVAQELCRRGEDCVAATRADFDLTDGAAVAAFVAAQRPDAVIHCAAYTAVDRAEDEPARCRAVNADGTEHIARACAAANAKLVYISTDYVFPGHGDRPYETDDPVGPQNVYGCSKLAGERAVQALLRRYAIVRISWVFGQNGANFVTTMLRLAAQHDALRVVADQIGSPTYTADLAPLLCDLAAGDACGVYHATNEGFCSWAEFAAEIFRRAGVRTQVRPIATKDYPTKAARPQNSRLSKRSLDAAGFARLPSWQDALARYLQAKGCGQ